MKTWSPSEVREIARFATSGSASPLPVALGLCLCLRKSQPVIRTGKGMLRMVRMDRPRKGPACLLKDHLFPAIFKGRENVRVPACFIRETKARTMSFHVLPLLVS